MITRRAKNRHDRRRFLARAGALGLGVVGAKVLMATPASAAEAGQAARVSAADTGPSDGAILNFALNLEYLEGEFYSYAVHGHGLADNLTHGTGTRGNVTGGRQVPFKTPRIRQYAQEIAGDELGHVGLLRTALGSTAVSRPAIDIRNSFTAAARAAKLVHLLRQRRNRRGPTCHGRTDRPAHAGHATPPDHDAPGGRAAVCARADPTSALVLSQVVLSFGIPFALIALLVLTTRRCIMGGQANSRTVIITMTVVVVLLSALNLILLADAVR